MTRLSVLLLLLAASFSMVAEPASTVLAGEGFVTTANGRHIVVALDTNRDESVDHRFVLTSESPLSDEVALGPEPVRVEFAPGRAVIAGARRMIELYVPGYEGETRVPPAFEFTRYAATLGLAHYPGETFRCPATSCSVTNGGSSCSITCPGGSCACCNYGTMIRQPSCKCVRR